MRATAMPRLGGFYLVMLLIALSAMALRGQLASVLPPLALRPWATAVGLGLGVGLATVGLSRLLSRAFRWARSLEDEFRGVLGNMDGRQVLFVATFSAIAEESLFRGLLQPLLGLWIAAAIFGVLHVGPSLRFVPWTVMAFVAGIVFGLMFGWTGNLMAPIIAHFLINYINLRHLTASDPETYVALGEGGHEHLARR